ncbi:MAG: hypothetical protein IPH37_14250 [Burkholderiales bacterium]|nr:hypothetical protein [Burkholderiales bacterium]
MHYQTNLIEDEDTLQAPTTAVGSTLALGALKFDATQLSPAQKRFNQLLAQTETLAKKIASARQAMDTHHALFASRIPPLERQRDDCMRQMVLLIDARLKQKA